MKRFALSLAFVLAVVGVSAQVPSIVQQTAARLDAAAQHQTSATTATTLTLTPNGGETIYIYTVDIDNCSNATGGPVGAPTSITTTNLTGSPAWTMGSGSTTAATPGGPGLCQPPLKISYPTGLKATAAGTAVTFVLPTFATNQIIRLNVGYRSAPLQ